MKAKSLFSLAIIVMALAGCSENEITEQNPDANKPIGFDTYTAAQARGAENGLPAVKTSGFGVMAYQTLQHRRSKVRIHEQPESDMEQ